MHNELLWTFTQYLMITWSSIPKSPVSPVKMVCGISLRLGPRW